jgi:predicted RNA-binding Zn-ribbon protein involved in translation (DUF1610 family)
VSLKEGAGDADTPGTGQDDASAGTDMTIIKATCPSCGDVELSRDQVRLVVHPLADRSFYGFTCTLCGEPVRKPAGDEVVRLLTMGGVIAERIQVPAEALEQHSGPPVSADEVLDFAAWLSTASSIAEVAGVGLFRRPGGSGSEVTRG